jgi:hypothetical protein
MEKRIIKLPAGGDLEVFTTPKLFETIRQHFNLNSVEEVTDNHIRMFIYGSTKSALDKMSD